MISFSKLRKTKKESQDLDFGKSTLSHDNPNKMTESVQETNWYHETADMHEKAAKAHSSDADYQANEQNNHGRAIKHIEAANRHDAAAIHFHKAADHLAKGNELSAKEHLDQAEHHAAKAQALEHAHGLRESLEEATKEYHAGSMAAVKGKKYSDNPHAKGTQEHLDWSKGHNDLRARKSELSEAVDKKDTVTMDIPLLIRVLELTREDIKTDAGLHRMVEKLIAIRNKGTLTMDNYDTISQLKEGLEYVAELDKTTLKNYIKRAHEDSIQRATAASYKSGAKGDKYNKAGTTRHEMNRERGMSKALNKLSEDNKYIGTQRIQKWVTGEDQE
jgi:hypothetical protein